MKSIFSFQASHLPSSDCLKKVLFSTNLLARLLSDSLLSDSSISKSHSKLQFKSTSFIQSRSYVQRARWLSCFWRLIAGRRPFSSPEPPFLLVDDILRRVALETKMVGGAMALECFRLLCQYFNANFAFLS